MSLSTGVILIFAPIVLKKYKKYLKDLIEHAKRHNELVVRIVNNNSSTNSDATTNKCIGFVTTVNDEKVGIMINNPEYFYLETCVDCLVCYPVFRFDDTDPDKLLNVEYMLLKDNSIITSELYE
jgi:hypothetical protein